MTPTRPGNEPDPGDMSTEPGNHEDPSGPADLPEGEAESLGDFA